MRICLHKRISFIKMKLVLAAELLEDLKVSEDVFFHPL